MATHHPVPLTHSPTHFLFPEQPELLCFQPYTKEEIEGILQDKLVRTPTAVDKAAITLCARKVSSTSGDIRKALDVCKTAVNISAVSRPGTPPSVRISDVASVLDSRLASRVGTDLPLHHKLALCALIISLRGKKTSQVLINKVRYSDCFSNIIIMYVGKVYRHVPYLSCSECVAKGTS